MTKEEWLKARTKEEIPMEVWWQYYQDKGGDLKDYKKFEQLFTNAFWDAHAMGGNIGIFSKKKGTTNIVSMHTAVKKLFQYYDKKFDIT